MTRQTRLRFHLQPQGAVWYHVQASNSHVLIDPQPEARALAPGFVRPIELWRAPRWQRPSSVNMFRDNDNRAVASVSADSGEVANHAGGEHHTGDATGSGRASGTRTRADPLADLRLPVGGVITLASVVDFVSDASAVRLGALGALLDAVAAALAGGPSVVLAAPDADQGALWIGAVSFFAPPATCLRLSFSTYERLDDVLGQEAPGAAEAPGAPEGGTGAASGSARSNGTVGDETRERLSARGGEHSVAGDNEGWHRPILSVVPETDVDRLSRRDDLPVVVIDPRVEATFDLVNGVAQRRTRLGQEIKITDWSRLALDLCCENYTALERCLRRLDEVGPASPNGRSAAPDAQPDEPVEPPDPAWSLAAAVARTDSLPLALPLATGLLRDLPGPARLPSELAEIRAPLITDDAEQAWRRLQSALDAESVTGIRAALDSYLRLALTDDSWLLRQVPPLPAEAPVDPGLPARLRGPLARLAHRLTHDLPGEDDPAGDVRCGVLMLRTVDFAHRIARLIGGPNLIEAGIGRLAGRAAEVLLDKTAGPRVAAIVGPLDGAGLARWIVPPLSPPTEPWQTSGNPIGERLSAPVIALLAGAVDPARLITSTRSDPLAAEPVALEVAAASAFGRIAGDPRLRGPAVEYLLHRSARAYPDADPAPMVAEAFGRLVGDEPWETSALLRLVEHAPAALGAELVPVVLRQLPDWVDDPLSARLAATLLKRIQFLPRLGADRQLRPRRAGTTDGQAQLLNLLATTGPGWLQLDDGLHRRAAEILMWGDRAWPGADPTVQRLIAPRITVAAFQVALAAEPAQATTVLAARLAAIPVGSGWQPAVEIGLEPALPLLAQVLRLNRYRLAGELVIDVTRAMIRPTEPAPGRVPVDRPRLAMLPGRSVIGWLVAHEALPELEEHLAALVLQEIQAVGSVNRGELIAFWEPALPAALGAAAREGRSGTEQVIEEVLQVALGFADAAGRPLQHSDLAGLLPTAATPANAGAPAGSAEDTRIEAEPSSLPARSRWWWRWSTR
ncbi:MAG TPA: hypothetical protein VLL08_06045 [Kineosporiaceae bacterium]|nr:hypothetical protein [Kineosporiaceae bacterium]